MREYDPDHDSRFQQMADARDECDHHEAAVFFDALKSAYEDLKMYLVDDDDCPTEDHPELVRETLDRPYRPDSGDSEGYKVYATSELEDAAAEYVALFKKLEKAFTLGTKLPQPGYSARMLKIIEQGDKPCLPEV